MFDSLLQSNPWKSNGLALASLLCFQDLPVADLSEQPEHDFDAGRFQAAKPPKMGFETDVHKTEKEGIKLERGFQIKSVDFVKNEDKMTIGDDDQQKDPTYSPNTPVHAALYPCEKCGKHFKTQASVETHSKKHLKMEDNQCETYKCTICSKTVSSKYILATHMKSHNNDDRCLCNICSKSFANKYILKSHMQAHSEVNLPCDVCLKSFSNKYHLKNHKKIHEANVLCNICSKLVSNIALKSHMKNMHGESKHVPCSNCGSNYRMSTVQRHQRLCKSTDEERKARKAAIAKNCERCGKVLSNSSKLKKHMKICV